MNISYVRRITEMAYCFAWGNSGSADLRDEFLTAYRQLGPQIGKFSYHGVGEFEWGPWETTEA